MPRAHLLPILTLLVAPLVVPFAGCSSDDATPPVENPSTGQAPSAVFTVPASAADLDGARWFEHPWPSDARRDPSGSIRLDGWPNPRLVKIVQTWQEQLRGKVDGFSPLAAGYLTFTAAIDPAKLPADAKASLSQDSALQLVDVDDASPERGERHPIIWTFRDRVGDYYLLANTLSWAPSLGRPLRPKTKYAIVATKALTGKDGTAIAPNAELQQVLAGEGPLGAAWAGALDALAAAGVPRDRIGHLSVFTTSDPVSETLKVADHARALPPPKLKSIAADGGAAGVFDQYTGVFEGSPDYQEGTPPYYESGGGFVFDEAGVPVKQRDFELRFKLVVPVAEKCPAPAGGYPIVLYAHGTTGDWRSFIGDGTAKALAEKCIASMGVDQIFHGTRPGAPPEGDPSAESKISLAFFNFGNAYAFRTNIRQSAIDEVARARLVSTGGLVVPADVSKTAAAIAFDPNRIGFFGHSQGGLNGALLLAIDDQTRGGVLSGAGSAISYSLLLKTKPDPSVAGLVKALMAVDADNEDEITPLHPIMALAQTLVDPADPVHYYGGMAKAPLHAHTPKSVLMTEGVNPDGSGDNFAPPRTIEAGAIAGGFPLVQPMVFDVPEITHLAGQAPVALPLKGNAAAGKATVALAQFSPPAGRDGHFVVFNVPAARALTTSFCKSLLEDDVATIGE